MPAATHTFHTAYILRVSLVAGLGGLLFGFDTSVISGAVPFITTYFALADYSLGWAVSSILIGCAAGALVAGALAEAFGRRFVLFVCAVLFGVSAVGSAASTTLTEFVAYRLVGGLGVGAAAVVSPMYIAELVPSDWRGRLVSLYQMAIVTGVLLSYAVNYGMADLGENNWRYMFGSEIIPTLLFFGMLFAVPETPRWLIGHGRVAEARAILERVGGPGFAEAEVDHIEASFAEADPQTSELSLLFSPRYLPIVVIGVMVAVFQQITGINSILYYAPYIFAQTGLDTSSALLQTIGIGAINFLAVLVAIALVDRVGRRPLLLFGSAAMVPALIGVALCFHYRYFDHYLVLVFMLLYVGAFGATLGAVTWVFLSEVFPNRIRGLAMAAATLALWLANFVVTYTFPIMTERLGTAATLLTYAGACALACAYTYYKVPETRGKTLEEIEAAFAKTYT